MIKEIQKPLPGEYAPYTILYIDQTPGDLLVLDQLREQLEAVRSLFSALPAERLDYRYAADKWSLKEVLVHIMDTERVFAYRALRFARNDQSALAGFEQDDYVPYSHAGERTLPDILEEYAAIRTSTISLFRHLHPEDLLRTGVASNHAVSVRALAFMIAGHELHHMNVVRERYL